MTVIPSQGINNVAVGKISKELVIAIDSSTMTVDKVPSQQSLVCVDEVAKVATKRTKAAHLSDRKLLGDDS